LAVSR